MKYAYEMYNLVHFMVTNTISGPIFKEQMPHGCNGVNHKIGPILRRQSHTL